MSNDLTPAQGGNDPSLQALVGQIRDLIRDARGRALWSVDAIQVRTCREIGRHIVEFEQSGAARGIRQAVVAQTGGVVDCGIRAARVCLVRVS